MSRLRHPNIVRVFDVDAENGLYSLVMEHVKGRSLKGVLETGGPLPLDRAVELACQVGAALTSAHTAEPAVIHRDVKPANILVEDATGRAVVTDFGIAKLVDVEESSATRTGSRLGTPQYCAPEQLSGQHDLDARSDVYAFGMVVYEMVTGSPLMKGLDAEVISRRVLGDADEHEIALDAALPSALRAIIGKAVRKNRDDRYATIAAMLEDLRRLVPSSTTDGASGAPTTVPAPAPGSGALEDPDAGRITRHDDDSRSS
jgi:serine/threonine-protein kinase